MTGAARSAVPRAATCWRICAEASAEMVEQSTRMDGIAVSDMSPPGPSTAARRSSDVPTVAKTMSQPDRSAAESTTFAPSAVSGCALAFVRL